MKKVLVILAVLTSSLCISQIAGDNRRISFGLFQDPKLALFEDDYGNKPFTTDVRFEFMMEGKSQGAGSVLIGLTFEYADLSEFNFARYGFQGGYNFRNYNLPFNLGYFDNAIYVGGGVIMRNFPEDNQGYISLELTNDFAIFLSDWVSLNIKGTLMQRGDLAARYGDSLGSFNPLDWRLNVYVGVKFYIRK